MLIATSNTNTANGRTNAQSTTVGKGSRVQYIGFSSYYNAGQNGKGMSAMTSKFTTESLANYDLVTVLCGTNDYADSRELGSISDTSSNNTFYGYTKKVIETIIQQNPKITIKVRKRKLILDKGSYLNERTKEFC